MVEVIPFRCGEGEGGLKDWTRHLPQLLMRGGAAVARLAHNQEAGGSIPPPATSFRTGELSLGPPTWFHLLVGTTSKSTLLPNETTATTRYGNPTESRSLFHKCLANEKPLTSEDLRYVA